MIQISAENIYSQIVLLSDAERDELYNRMTLNFYLNSEVIAYSADGEPLTHKQYKKRVNAGILQCLREEGISFENLSNELGYNYADL